MVYYIYTTFFNLISYLTYLLLLLFKPHVPPILNHNGLIFNFYIKRLTFTAHAQIHPLYESATWENDLQKNIIWNDDVRTQIIYTIHESCIG